MVLSTPAKVASGVAAASTAVVGTAVAYKYGQSKEEVLLFKPDRDAMSASSWTVSTITTSSTQAQPKTLSFTVSITSSGGQDTSPWTCTLIASATEVDSKTADSSGIKEDLATYFGTLNDSSASTTTNSTPTKSQKDGFVKSCARNRKPNTTPSDNKVEGELKFTLTKQTGDKYKFQAGELETLFKGDWKNK